MKHRQARSSASSSSQSHGASHGVGHRTGQGTSRIASQRPINRQIGTSGQAVWELPALVGTASLILARCLFHETLRNTDEIIPGQVMAPIIPGAAASLAMDAAMVALAIVVALARVIAAKKSGRPIRLVGWCQGLFFALAGYMLASTAWATDHFAALVGGADLLSAASSLWLISQLVRSWRHFRLVLAACLGLLLIYGIYSLNYRYVDWKSTVDRWVNDTDGTRSRLFAANHWQPGDPAAKQYESNLLAGALTGYNSSANTFSAVIVLLSCGIVGIGIQRTSRRDGLIWLIVPAAGVFAAIWMISHTASRTAWGTLALSIVAFGALAIAGNPLARHRRAVFITCVGLALAAVAAVIATGLIRGNLFHDSLTFRWQYWVASAKLWMAHPILGVGASNFGDFYLQYRLPVAPEEVRDPHNLFVRFFTEGGLIGGLLAIGFVLTLAWQLSAPTLPVADELPYRLPGETSEKGSGLAIMLAIPLVSVVLSLLIGLDFTSDTNYIIVQCYTAGIYLLVMVIGSLVGSIESARRQFVDGRPSPWLVRGAAIGAGLFLLHGMIDFAFFETGPMHLLMLIAGSVLGIRAAGKTSAEPSVASVKSLESSAGNRRYGPMLAGLAVLGVAWVIGVSTLVGPACAAEAQSNDGNLEMNAGQPLAAAESYHRAEELMPSNGLYAYRAAGAQMMAGGEFNSILKDFDQALSAEPMNIRYRLGRARLARMVSPPRYDLALKDYAQVMVLNPNDFNLRIEYAQALVADGQSAQAIDQYKKALWYNDQLPPTEIRRLSPEQVRDVEKEITRLGTR